jgi:hypothetical protein
VLGGVDGDDDVAGAAGVAAGAAFDSVLASDFSLPFVEFVVAAAVESVFSGAFFDDE